MNKVLVMMALTASVISAQSIQAKTVTDELLSSKATFASSSAYCNFTLSGTSGATYAGNAFSGNTTSWQLNKNTTGLWVTAAPKNGKLVSISYTKSNTASSKSVVTIYGSATAYTSKPTSTALTTVTYSGLTANEEQTYTFNEDYSAFGFVSTTAGASYWSSIKVTWEIADEESGDSESGDNSGSGDNESGDNSGSEDNSGNTDNSGNGDSSDNNTGDNNGGDTDNSGDGDNNTETPEEPTTPEVSPASYRYLLVSSADELVAGKKYLIVAGNYSKTLSTTYASSSISSTTVTLNSDKSVLTNPADDALVLTLGGSTGAWTWTAADGTSLYGTKSNNSLTLSETAAKTGVTFKNNNATISIQSGSNQILYNTSGIFKHYSSSNAGKSGYGYVQIYVQEEQPKTPSLEFAEIAEQTDEAYYVVYGSNVKVSAENATTIDVEITETGSESSYSKNYEGDSAEFEFTAPGSYTFIAKNESGESKTQCTILVARPVLPTITANNMTVEGSNVTLPLGTEVIIESKYANNIIVNGDETDLKANPYTFTFEGDTELTFVGKAQNETSEALTVNLIAQKFEAVAPVVYFNGEELSQTEVNQLPNYLPVIAHAEGAKAIRVTGDNFNTEVKTDSNWDAKIYFTDTNESAYDFVALYDDAESTAVRYTIQAVNQAAPVVSVAGNVIENNGQIYVSMQNTAAVKVVAEGANTILVQSESGEARYEGEQAIVPVSAAGSYLTYALYGEENIKSEALSFQVVSSYKYEKYHKVTSADQIVEGQTYVIAAGDQAMTAEVVASTMLGVTTVPVEDGVLTATKQLARVTAVKTGDAWTLSTFNSGDAAGLQVSNDKDLAITETPSEFTISIEDGNAIINVVGNTERAIRYNYNNGNNPRFGYYGEGQTNVQLYAVELLDTTPEVLALSEYTADEENTAVYYAGTMTVVYAYGREMWLEEESTGKTVHATISDDFDTELSTGDKISGVNINGQGAITEGYYTVNLVNNPVIATAELTNNKLEGFKAEVAEALTTSALGHYVSVKGQFTTNSFGQINTLVLFGDNEVEYTLVKHFEQSGIDSLDAEGEGNDEVSEWAWNALVNEWIESAESTPDANAEVTVNGFVDIVDEQIVLYPLTMTAQMLSTSVTDIVAATDTFVVNGNSVVLPEGAALYNLAGQRVNPEGLAAGVYVVRQATSEATKLIIR